MHMAEDVIVRGEDGESAEERSVIRSINEAAFGGSEEADLVDKLRTEGDALISLVAEQEKRKARSLEGPFPTEAFMAMELSPGALSGIRGKAIYPAAFRL
jgi:predicted N-acetyltransferase YhbS